MLGEHLLVRTPEGRRHLDPATGADRPEPGESAFRRLIDDALAASGRHGPVESVAGREATMKTGVVVTLDWQRLSLSQRGRDTAWIDALYRVHSLQWTGRAMIDRVLAAVGLFGLAALSLLGLRLALRR